MKVIRIITYEGNEKQLAMQMEWSLREGRCPFVGPVSITVQTIGSDISHEKFGEARPPKSIEDWGIKESK